MKSNDTPVNLLFSFAYMGKNKRLCEQAFAMSNTGKANVMIDSGAFSAFNNKGFNHVTLENYCNFLKDHGHECEKYVMLDVIGNISETRRNYDKMLRCGLKPMYVVTVFDNDFEYAAQTIDNCPHICVAGGATVKNKWLYQKYQRVFKVSRNRAMIHGLAFVILPQMLQLPLASVDSSSWGQGARMYGLTSIFDGRIHNYDSLKFQKAYRNGDLLVRKTCEELHIASSEVFNQSYYRHNNNLPLYISSYMHMKYQRFAYRRGLRYFLAVTDVSALRAIRYHQEEDKEAKSFQKFRKG